MFRSVAELEIAIERFISDQCRAQTLRLDHTPKPHPRRCQTWETSVRVSPLVSADLAERFAFGQNWTAFLGGLNDQRIAEAEKSVQALPGMDSLRDKRILELFPSADRILRELYYGCNS